MSASIRRQNAQIRSGNVQAAEGGKGQVRKVQPARSFELLEQGGVTGRDGRLRVQPQRAPVQRCLPGVRLRFPRNARREFIQRNVGALPA